MIHKEKLGSLCHINSGGTPSRGKAEFYGGKIPWAKIGDIEKSNGVIYSTEENITEAGLESIGNRIFTKGTLLFAMYGSVGKVAFCGIELSSNQAILGIRLKQETKEKLDLEYLKYWFQINLLFFKSRAVGGILKNLSATIVRDFDIPLPSITDQKRIAKVLSECEKLIQKRKESIDLLDDLLKSTFFQMFGDPVRNEKGWKNIPMEEAVIDINSGVSYGGVEKKELEQDELGVLKISAVTSGVFNPKEFKAVKRSIIDKKIISVSKGMILISRANTRELVAACCIIPENYENLFIPDKLWSITLDTNKIHPVFFNYLLKNENYRNLIRKKASGGHDSMLNISMQKFRTLKLIMPDNQMDFVKIVDKIDGIKSNYQESLLELENLYGSISQRAFNGELDLSKVDITDMEDSKKKDLEEVKEDLTDEQKSVIDAIERIDELNNSFEHILPNGDVPSKRQTDIRNMSIRQYLRLPENDEATHGIEFDSMDKDFFYQFILKDGFSSAFFTIQEVEQYARKYILRGKGYEFTYDNWKTIIFRFIGAKQPIIEQFFDEETKTIKLKLTDEAFKV